MPRSHLTVLRSSTARNPSLPVFKVPQLDQASGRVESWTPISYQQFWDDVEFYARHWTRTFTRDGVPPKSVVGLWIGGFTYADALHIYGISRAGYIPQLFSLRLPNPVVIYELLQKADAKALVYDQSYDHVLSDCFVPRHLSTPLTISESTNEPLPDISQISPEEIAFIFHTSGSTSGSPKLVPCSFSWIDSAIEKSNQISRPLNPGRQDVTVWMGSMCHIGQTFMLLGSLQHGSCTIQFTAQSFPSTELIDMIHHAGLNRLNQFASFLGNHIKAARMDPKLLTLLAGLDDILYSGLPLPREDEEWAYKNGLKVRNLFGSTECGAILLSVGASARNPGLLRALDGFTYRFVSTAPAASASGHQSTARLMELVIPAESPDCPHPSLRQADGDFHTGDLFQEVSPGLYVSRGRDDDWIKSENSLRCDTKAIEDNALAMCGNLIAQCVVVGSGRPSPVMFIEPRSDVDPEKVKKEVIRKTRHFHSRRYLHERISHTDMIVVVAPQSLPRTATKGNIRRKAVEDAYKAQIDQIFARVR
ncbi:putative amp- ligase [Lyophyllum shimeji]|uniref:Amp- ligase n=1 Tax=Lyophyllum shimeji TaxID=47721 RepID=A0A9P3PWQ7_LYOSH|nr:putative amp- ligase [Lyophyllum shimeji]